MGEEWRSVVGFEGYYEVSSKGRVRSVSRYVRAKANGTKWYVGKVLSAKPGSAGYPQVTLSVNAVHHQRLVHNLVADAFLELPTDSLAELQVRHWDDDKLNNCVENLLYGTPSQNGYDASRNRKGQKSKTHCPRGHPYSGPNLKQNGRGHRECRTCRGQKGFI